MPATRKHLRWSTWSCSPPPEATRCRGVGRKEGLTGPAAEPRRLGGFSAVVFVRALVMTKLLRLVVFLPRLVMERGLSASCGPPSQEEAPKAAAGGTGKGMGRGKALVSRGASK